MKNFVNESVPKILRDYCFYVARVKINSINAEEITRNESKMNMMKQIIQILHTYAHAHTHTHTQAFFL